MANQKEKNNNSGSPVAKRVRGGQARFFKVASFTEEGKTYLVRQLPDGEWRCGCLDFTMNEVRRRRQGESIMCDHIRKVRKIKMRRHGKATKKSKTK